jgi:hypothetical protein
MSNSPTKLTNPSIKSQATVHLYPNLEFTIGFAPSKRAVEQLALNRLVSCQKSEHATRKYNLTGITSYGRRSLRNASYLLAKKYTHRKLGFYTCTLSSVSKESLKILIDNWSDISHRFFQELQRYSINTKGQKYEYLYCVELQLKRSQRVGLPIPHIHWLAPAFVRRTNKFIISADKIRDIWASVVSYYISEDCSYESSIDCQLVKADAGRYLSKYISKAATKGTTDYFLNTPYPFTCRYWGMSEALGRQYRGSIKKYEFDKAQRFVDICFLEVQELLEYSFPIEIINKDGNFIRVGYVGKLNVKGLTFVHG